MASRSCAWLGVVLAVHLGSGAASAGTPVGRPDPASGTVVSRAAGEIVRFVAEPDFRDLVVGQDLLAGDLVRTGVQGALSLIFVDRTVMRLHPNTELLVKSVAPLAAELALTSGLVWARTPREGGGSITIETPSAAAAIRGTDWSLAVGDGQVTRLAVFDGTAELSNPLGSVTVPAGAAGVAAPGRAPVLVQVANLREREQMLFTLTAPMAGASLARATGRVMPGQPPAVFAAALARYDAGAYDEAAAMLEAAAPTLGAERAAAARWIAAFARAASGAAMQPPASSGAVMDVLGRAYLAAHSGDLDAAAGILAEAGDQPVALGAAVEVALYRDRADEAEALLSRLQAVAAGTAEALSAEADVEMIARGNDLAAARLLHRAVVLEPDEPDLWNDLGLAEDGLGHPLEAERAFRRALELAPGMSNALANLSILLLDQYRHDEARAIIDQLLDADPGSYLGLRSRARLAIQEGRGEDAIAAGLGAVAAQPAAAESSIILAIAAWQEGDRIRALQELDAAQRLDPNDPVVPSIRTVIALDEARADDAIRAALEAERLYRLNEGARRLAADRASGSYVVEAFSNIGLSDWARDVNDRTFDPLSAASLFSEALTPRPTIGTTFAGEDAALGSSLVQGLLIEPLGVAGRVRDRDILRRPFIDGELTGRLALGDPDGVGAAALVQGYAAGPIPFSFAFQAAGEELDGARRNNGTGGASLVALAGAQPSARFGAVGILTVNRQDDRLPGPVSGPTAIDDDETDSLIAGAGLTVRLSERSLLTAFASHSLTEGTSGIRRFAFNQNGFFQLDVDQRQRANAQFAGLGWRSDDDDGTWFAGIEGVRAATEQRQIATVTDLLGGGTVTADLRQDDESHSVRGYLDRRFDLGGRLDAAAELGVTATAIGEGDAFPLSPRLGLAITPAPGHRLRAALVHETATGGLTLGPVTTLGLVPVAAPVQPGGETAAAIFRYDGTLTGRLHLSFEHQSIHYEDLVFDNRDLVAAVAVEEAVLHRTELSANAWLGGGFGAFASGALAHSEIRDGAGRGLGLPDVPEQEARFGLAWVHPAQVRATVEQRWTGERADGLGGELDPVWTTDASLFWEPFEKRLRLGVEARNVLDADVELPFDQGVAGRSVWLSGSVRF